MHAVPDVEVTREEEEEMDAIERRQGGKPAGATESSRSAFEAWFTRNDPTPDMAARAVTRNSAGFYLLLQAQTSWEIWQASRDQALEEAAALLDGRWNDVSKTPFLANPSYYEGQMDALDVASEAIRALKDKQ